MIYIYNVPKSVSSVHLCWVLKGSLHCSLMASADGNFPKLLVW